MPTPRSLKKIGDKVRTLHSCHVERHQPSGFEFAFADRIDFLDAAAWDHVTAQASIVQGRAYQRALERAAPDNVRPHHALIYDAGEPVAALCAQSVQIRGDQLPLPSSKRAKLARLAAIDEQVLVCGNVMSWGPHGVCFRPGTDVARLWPAVADALHRMRRGGKLGDESSLVLVKDVDDTLWKSMGALERFSYRPLETEPNMVLTLAPRWKSYEDYLASLTGDYRRDARKLAKKVEAAGFELVRVYIVREAARLHELYCQVHAEQKMRLFKLPEAFLAVLASELGERVRVLGLRKEGRLMAFTTLIVDGDTAIGSFVGHERAALAEAPLYLRLLHELVAEAIAVGAKRLSLGRTALEPKARLGAKPERLRTWVRHRSPLLNLVLRSFLSAIPHDEAPERSPFKA
jgi:hypothetical protein